MNMQKNTTTIVCASELYTGDLSYCKDSRIIACDGGYDHLRNTIYTPDYTIGDMDSVSKIPDEKNIHIQPREKDATDTAYAVEKALSFGTNTIFCIAATAGRLDHSLANLALLAKYAHTGVRIFLIGKENCIFALSDGNVLFTGKEKGYFSVFAYSDTAHQVSIHNALYEIENKDLKNTVALGVSNEFIEKRASVSVKKGTLLLVTEKLSREALLNIAFNH